MVAFYYWHQIRTARKMLKCTSSLISFTYCDGFCIFENGVLCNWWLRWMKRMLVTSFIFALKIRLLGSFGYYLLLQCIDGHLWNTLRYNKLLPGVMISKQILWLKCILKSKYFLPSLKAPVSLWCGVLFGCFFVNIDWIWELFGAVSRPWMDLWVVKIRCSSLSHFYSRLILFSPAQAGRHEKSKAFQ